MMSTNRPRIVRLQGPTPAEWDKLRPVIERLYKHENKTESEVRRVLLENHGLSVTPKMFKQHIRKWKLDKKHKRHEMIFALQKTQQRKAQGKPTKILIRGEELTEVKLFYYFKRRPMSTTEQQEAQEGSSTPSDVEYLSPDEDDVDTTLKQEERQLELVLLAPRPMPHKATPDSHEDDEAMGIMENEGSTTKDLELSRPISPPPMDLLVLGHPQQWSINYDLNPQESFMRQLFEHVRLSTGGEIARLYKKTRFDTSGIMRASGWFDSHLNQALEFEAKGQITLAQHIVKKCATIIAAEVEGYFPDQCVLEMVEVMHFLQRRNARQLQLRFMYDLYDGVTQRLGQFHPLVELLCAATQGYTSTISSTLIPTMLDFLNTHSDKDVSLNLLLPLFAFQQLRAIDTLPQDLIMRVLPDQSNRCQSCIAVIESSAFVSPAFRTWAARQFITLLNDVWVTPNEDQNAVWHSTMRSRVWRYIWKYPQLTERKARLEKMPLKERFWAVARLCFELVSRMIEKVFLERNNFFPADEHVKNMVLDSSRKTILKEEEIKSLYMDMNEPSIFDTDIHAPGSCEEDLCKEVGESVQYWIGIDLGCANCIK